MNAGSYMEKDWCSPVKEGVAMIEPELILIEDVEEKLADEKPLRAITVCETQADEDKIKEVLAENAAVDADIA